MGYVEFREDPQDESQFKRQETRQVATPFAHTQAETPDRFICCIVEFTTKTCRNGTAACTGVFCCHLVIVIFQGKGGSVSQRIGDTYLAFK